jgi:hypothetical protein
MYAFTPGERKSYQLDGQQSQSIALVAAAAYFSY